LEKASWATATTLSTHLPRCSSRAVWVLPRCVVVQKLRCRGREGSSSTTGRKRERASVLARAHVCVLAYGLQGSPLAPEWIDLGLRELEALAAGPAWDRAGDLFADKAKPPKAAVIFLHGTGDSGAGAQVGLLALRAVANKRLRLFFYSRALPPTSALLETRRHTSSLEDQPSVQPC